MPSTVIKVENLSKQFRIGVRQQGYKTFREAIVDTTKAPLRLLSALFSTPSALLSSKDDTIWALRDVSFEVKRGEVVGIIGRNGAGKSTLLKVLSKITEPTKGKVELKGRVGSLLEVGTGFHPELTGHENIYLYGAILGMDRYEVTRKFDEIVAFAELEKFINTPIKRYSSGMYMRLAFAVAAHMETEILLIDEVLAVGDVKFQKKCIEEMDNVAKAGRTLLFVSHNMTAISNLCNRCVLLKSGKVQTIDTTEKVVQYYLNRDIESKGRKTFQMPLDIENCDFFFKSVSILNTQTGESTAQLNITESFYIEIEYILKKQIDRMVVFFEIWNMSNVCVLSSTDRDKDPAATSVPRKPGTYRAGCLIPGNLLRPGTYFLNLSASVPRIRFLASSANVLSFEITEHGWVVSEIGQGRSGLVVPLFEWDEVLL